MDARGRSCSPGSSSRVPRAQPELETALAAQAHTGDQKVRKGAGFIADLAPTGPDLSAPPVPDANSPFLAYGASGESTEDARIGLCSTREGC